MGLQFVAKCLYGISNQLFHAFAGYSRPSKILSNSKNSTLNQTQSNTHTWNYKRIVKGLMCQASKR